MGIIFYLIIDYKTSGSINKGGRGKSKGSRGRGAEGKNFKRLKTALINFFVGADIDQDDLLFSDDQFQGDAKADIDGHTMQAGKSALERMQPQ